HPPLFDIYAQVTALLASGHPELLQTTLRTFELLLLREIGLLPLLDAQTMTLRALDPAQAYVLVPEGGLREATSADRASLSGAQWLALQLALADSAPFSAALKVCALHMAELKPQLRTLLNYHCGVGTLRTRQMMIDLQSL
ncbi:MAG: DNA repair protein RecO, partial [Alphaproteobacteria bacterium]|nr:DNA repair protein RecO [Alphaproteobacteria bacterium]